jgi:hypothetical protein
MKSLRIGYAGAVILLVIFTSFTMFGCDSLVPANTNAPSYIKDVVAYKEGTDAFYVYVILADANGSMTTADGSLEMRMVATVAGRDVDIYRNTYPILKSHIPPTLVVKLRHLRDLLEIVKPYPHLGSPAISTI